MTNPSPGIPQKQEPSTDPACWSWRLPDERKIRRFRERLEAKPRGRPFTPEDVRWRLMAEWHCGCAVCGCRIGHAARQDHDHETGLFRGFLCGSCNAAEGVSDAEVFVKYRERNPAVMFNIKHMYDYPSRHARDPIPWHLLPDRQDG